MRAEPEKGDFDMKTIVGMYDNLEDGRQVVQDLLDSGIERARISLVAADSEGRYATDLKHDGDSGDTIAGGAATGAVVGGLGGLLIGLGALAIPGIGPVIAAGPIVATLVGAGVGAAVGGLVGALVAAGVPEEQAGYYAEGVRRGSALVTVEVPEERVDEVVRIMERHHPVDIDERATSWQREGWTGFDANRVTSTTTDEWNRSRNAGNGGNAGNSGNTTRAGNGYSTTTSANASNVADADLTEYDPFFRNHYQTHYANSGDTYAQFEPAYRYGYILAVEERYYTDDWADIEPEARQYWSENYPDTPWEKFKDAVRYGWQQVKHAVAR
jgi:hypothetical protein